MFISAAVPLIPTTWMKPWRPAVVSGVSVACGSVSTIFAARCGALTSLSLAQPGMDRDALDVDLGAVGREGLVDDLAQVRAVERVGEVGLQVGRQVGMHAAADLLVGREADADRAVRQIRACCSRWRAAAMMMAMPALSSAPSSVVPEAVTMSSPTFCARYGSALGESTCSGSSGSTMSSPS